MRRMGISISPTGNECLVAGQIELYLVHRASEMAIASAKCHRSTTRQQLAISNCCKVPNYVIVLHPTLGPFGAKCVPITKQIYPHNGSN